MKTIKLPYVTSQSNIGLIKQLQKEQSAVFRWAYNRIKEGIIEKDIRNLAKNLKNITNLDSWFIQCAIKEAFQQVNSEKSLNINKSIFGGKRNFFKRIKNEIPNTEWKKLRLRPIIIQGEKNYYGNRKFKLLIIEENKIIFKHRRNSYLQLSLPKLRKNIKQQLFQLQNTADQKKTTFTIKLDKEYIYISYENEEKIQFCSSGNYIGIDLNPNYISCSFFNKNKQLNQTWNFNLTKLTKQLNKNKIIFESIEISKRIIQLCEQNLVKFIFIEKFNFKTLTHFEIRNINRLINNLWPRAQLILNLKKRAKLAKIILFEINPAYSSQIGNIQNQLPDPISASMEIARRSYSCIIEKTKQFYPPFDKTKLSSQWKDLIEKYVIKEWKELFSLIKNLKLKYRVSWSNDYVFRKFITCKSKVNYNCYIYN